MKYQRIFLIVAVFAFSYCERDEPAIPEVPEQSVQTSEIIPSNTALVYQTSFEDVSVKNANELTWKFPHWFEFAAMHREDGGSGSGLGGARMWVEGMRVRTGKKSIGLEVFDIEKSRRSEFIIFPSSYLGKEYYVSYWLYLPTDWGLYDPTITWDWFEIGNLYNSGGQPYAGLHISNPDSKQQYFDVSVFLRDQAGKKGSAGAKRMLLPKGRWFEVHYYVKRDTVNGTIKLWFDGQLIADKSGIQTQHRTDPRFTISIAKIYHERGDKKPHRVWIDDLKLYNVVR